MTLSELYGYKSNTHEGTTDQISFTANLSYMTHSRHTMLRHFAHMNGTVGDSPQGKFPQKFRWVATPLLR
jgi:hypothetical protein